MQSIRKSVRNLNLVVLLLFVLATVCISTSANQARAEDATEANWLSYNDPRFDFTFEYPAHWIVNPRDDSDLAAISGVVSFTDTATASSESQNHQDPHKASSIQFVIGHYLAEYNPDRSLSSWKDDYVTISEMNIPTEAFSRYEKHEININGIPALLVIGESPLTEFQVANIPNAHLSQISVVYGQNVNQGANIGKSGDTGVPGSYHLHFHIRKSANSVNLTGMSGFYPDSDYPFNFADCGYVQR